MKKLYLLVSMLFLLVGSVLVGCSSSSQNTSNESASNAGAGENSAENTSGQAEDPAAFYEGKKINFIIPYDPGGGYDEYARLIAPYLEKHTGAKIEINNMPGAGGMRGVNELWRAPKDGLTIGILNGSAMVTNQIAEIEGANYKLGEFGYLGRMVADLRVLTLKADGDLQSIDDMLNSERKIKLGATGLGGSTYVDAVITAQALNLDQEVIHGFDSSGVVEQSIARGEVDGMWGSYGSRMGSVESGLAKVVLQSGKERSEFLPDVPTYFEVMENNPDKVNGLAKEILTALESLNAVGRPIAVPPGTSEDRLDFLQAAFDKAMNDPEFVQKITDLEREISYASGDDMLQIAKDATEMPDEVKAIVLKAVNGEL